MCGPNSRGSYLWAVRTALIFGWGIEKDLAEAVTWYRKAAEQGNAKVIGWGAKGNR